MSVYICTNTAWHVMRVIAITQSPKCLRSVFCLSQAAVALFGAHPILHVVMHATASLNVHECTLSETS